MVKASLYLDDTIRNRQTLRANRRFDERRSGAKFRQNLLRRFSSGKLSCVDVVDIASDAVRDGMLSRADPLFKIGSWKSTHNASRNLWNTIWKEQLAGTLADVYRTVECGRKNALGHVDVHKYNIILPHLLGKELYSMPDLFNKTFLGKAVSLDTFWEHASRQPWFLEHPAAHQVAADPSHCIPLRIHGDAAPVTKHSSTLVITVPLSLTTSRRWCPGS